MRQALQDRALWLEIAPQYVTVNEFYVPIYKGKGRPLWKMFFGVKLYQLLAGRKSLGNSRLISSKSGEVKNFLLNVID